MTSKKHIYSHSLHKFSVLIVLTILFQSCKVYQDPITLEQATSSSEKAYSKITLLNGDEYIYEKLEVVDGNYYGISSEKGEIKRTLLDKDEIQDVQVQNKKSSLFLNLLGITIGVASVFLGISML